MSVAAIHPPAAIFREDQNFAWWVYVLLALIASSAALGLAWIVRASGESSLLLSSIQLPLFLLVGLGLPTILVVGVLHMTTVVTPTECRVWFGWVPTLRHAVDLGDIRSIEVVTYNPLRESRGWGVHININGERVLNARGNRGVRLRLADGGRLLIGSQRPEELARVLDQARQAAA